MPFSTSSLVTSTAADGKPADAIRAVANARLPDVTTAQRPSGQESRSRRAPGIAPTSVAQSSSRCVSSATAAGTSLGSAYQFADEIADPPAVLDVTVEIEPRRPVLRPLIPGDCRGVVRVDEHAVAVEKKPVDRETHCLVGHEVQGIQP